MAITNISFSIGVLSPTFSSGTSGYDIFISSAAGSTVNITVTAGAGDILSINGTTVSSGVPFSYTLPNGSASISINVTGATTFGYAVTLFRTFTIPYSGLLTPPQVAVAYGLSLPTATSGSGYKVGIINFNDNFLQSDLNSSFADLIAAGLLPAGTVTPTVIVSNPGNRPLTVSTEPTQDIYSVAAMVPGATIVSYQPLPTGAVADLGVMYTELAARIIADAVDVVSFSYDWSGPTDNAFFAALDAAKIPFFYATNDYGAFNMDTSDVDYPSRIANSIAVGGTHLSLNPDNTRSSEVGETAEIDSYRANTSAWGSPGSTSTVAALPSFQSGLFYTTYNTITRAGSPRALTRRGVPDISAPMNGYVMYYKGNIVTLGGTSSSAPLLAGFIVRVMAATGIRKSSTEWNQFFYSNYGSSTFYDIIYGNNATGTPAPNVGDGYIATAGWDAVTGLGAPNGTGMIAAINNSLPRSSGSGTFPKSTGSVVYSADFNALQSTVADIRGIGENGYGKTVVSPTVGGSLINSDRVNTLFNNISSVYTHITNITTVTTTVTSGVTVISSNYYNQLKAMVDYCLNNRYTCHPNQFFRDGSGNLTYEASTSSIRTLPWGANGVTQITHKVRIAWATRLTALYYFNQGNYLTWFPNFEGSQINDLDIEWATWISHMATTPVEQFLYNRANFVAGSISTRNYSSGTLRISVLAVKSQSETAVDFTITYQNVDAPLLVVVPAAWAFQITMP